MKSFSAVQQHSTTRQYRIWRYHTYRVNLGCGDSLPKRAQQSYAVHGSRTCELQAVESAVALSTMLRWLNLRVNPIVVLHHRASSI